MTKIIKSFFKGFASSYMLMFKNNKLSRANREILGKDKFKLEQDQKIAKSKQ